MEDKETFGQTSPGRPFALRPSALSSSSGGFGSSLQQANTSSLLRPSALTAIADKIENASTETKKRKVEATSIPGKELCADDDEQNDTDNSKKSKVEDFGEQNASRKLILTEEVVPPQGIGTFGFIREDGNGTSKNNAAASSSSNKDSSNFIFGQNIHEKVTGFQDISSKDTNSTSDGKDQGSNDNADEEHATNLADRANEHMKKEESSKLHLKEVEVITGEEGERNVLQVNCKLHLFCHEDTTWIEKGRGTLKLNDICKSENQDVFQSRIVFRTQGSHMVILNTLLWPEMCYDKASIKSLRITAMNADTKKASVFLITASPKDVIQIHTAIDRRVTALKRSSEERHVSEHNEESCDNEANDIDEDDTRSDGGEARPSESEANQEVSGAERTSEDDKKDGESSDSGNSNDSLDRED